MSLVAPSPVDTQLGELLHGDGTLTEQDIQLIFAAQLESGERFGEAASRLGLVSEQEVQRALARHARISSARLRQIRVERRIDRCVSAPQQACGRAADAAKRVGIALVRARQSRPCGGRGQAGPWCNVLAANLAVTIAQLGERTLLIDANLRSPKQHTLFGLTAKYGLVDFIDGREGFNRVVTDVPGFSSLSVMCAGALPANPQELLGQVSFGYLLETAATKFDVVIVDTPPLLECADARLIAARARGVVLATKRHRTRMGDAMAGQGASSTGRRGVARRGDRRVTDS